MTQQLDNETILGYVEGDLPNDQRKRFETLLADDPKLRRLVTQIRDDRQQMRNLPSEDPPEDILEGVNRRLERNMLLDAPPPELMPSLPASSFRIGRWAAYAGLAAMIVLSTTLVIHTLSDGRLYDQFVTPREKHETPSTEQEGAGQAVRETAIRNQDDAPAIAELDLQENIMGPLAAAPGNAPARELPLEPPPPTTLSTTEKALDAIAVAKQATELMKPIPITGIKTFAKLTPVADVDHIQDNQPSPLVMRVFGHMARVDEGRGLGASDGMVPRRKADVPKPVKDDEAASALSPVAKRIEASVVDVTTQDPQATQTVVLSWAIANGVRIVGLVSQDATQAPVNAHTWPHVIGTAQAPEPTQQVRLAIASSQLPQLVADLDRMRGITATVAGIHLPWRHENTGPAKPPATSSPQAATEPTPGELDAGIATPTEAALNQATLTDNPNSSRPRTEPEPGVDDDFRTLSLEDGSPGSFDGQEPINGQGAAWPSPLSQTDWAALLRRWVPVHPTVPIYRPGTQLVVTVNIRTTGDVDPDTAVIR